MFWNRLSFISNNGYLAMISVGNIESTFYNLFQSSNLNNFCRNSHNVYI